MAISKQKSTPTILVMGVSGCGKSTIAKMLAQFRNAPFIEADDYHPARNRQKMEQGIPLSDEDRYPWLKRLNTTLLQSIENGRPPIIACSALKEDYRTSLLRNVDDNKIVWLDGQRECLLERMRKRQNHFMPSSLLDSQLETLEPPRNALRINIAQSQESILAKILKEFWTI